MFLNQFETVESDLSHIQYKHIKINEENFNKIIIKSLFEDKDLYRYVTNYSEERFKQIEVEFPIKQLISLIKNLKKEYIKDCIPTKIKKKLCKDLKAKADGVIIDTKQKDWEIKFNSYLENNITGYDVLAEIILSKIIEDRFGADTFVTKLAQTTNTNMKVFGIDTLHYNANENTMFFGESKLTNSVELGIQQHTAELILMDYKLNEECKLITLRENDIICKTDIIYEITSFGRKLTMNGNLSILKIKKEDLAFNIAIVYFIAHGEEFDYDYVTRKIKDFRKKIKLKNITVYCVTLPIKNKEDFIKKVEEVISEYE